MGFHLSQLGEKWKKEYIQPYNKGKGIRDNLLFGPQFGVLIGLVNQILNLRRMVILLDVLEEMIPSLEFIQLI